MNNFTYTCELDRVVDGDTVDLVVDLGFRVQTRGRVRLLGFDAPEPRGDTREEGREATRQVVLWFERNLAEELYLCSEKSGKYGRWLGDIFYCRGERKVSLIEHLLNGG